MSCWRCGAKVRSTTELVDMRRAPISDLPAWPRWLSHEEAARYCGVSVEVFDQEVRAGLWPPARRRGERGGRLTWDRLALDSSSDRASHLEAPDEPAGPAEDPLKEAKALALQRLDAAVRSGTGLFAPKRQKTPKNSPS